MWVKLCPEWVINSPTLSKWIDPTFITEPVKEIEEDKRFLKTLSKLHALQKPWDKTKEKLFENKNLPSLNFKPWSKAGPSCYSVKVNEGDRAHLQRLGDGKWLAIEIGSHRSRARRLASYSPAGAPRVVVAAVQSPSACCA
jgi:hypothetical protein